MEILNIKIRSIYLNKELKSSLWDTKGKRKKK